MPRRRQVYRKKQSKCNNKINILKQYIGTYNKLRSFHTIQITQNKIEYSDGTQFDVDINPKTNEIIAVYDSSEFIGKLKKHCNYDTIEWNNGSVWIKNGFIRFEGDYIHKSTQQKYIIDKLGKIQLPITGRKLPFHLLAPNRISYQFNRRIIHKGTITNNGNIKWDNGSVWEKQSKLINKESEKDALVQQQQPQQLQETKQCDAMNASSSQQSDDTNFVLINNDEIIQQQMDEWELV